MVAKLWFAIVSYTHSLLAHRTFLRLALGRWWRRHKRDGRVRDALHRHGLTGVFCALDVSLCLIENSNLVVC